MSPTTRRFTVGALFAFTIGFVFTGCATAPAQTARATSAPIAAPENCCNALERAVLDELNRARTNPARYADMLESELPYYHGTLFREPGESVPLQTREGASAMREAIRALRATPPLPAFRLSAGMTLGARDHVRDQASRGLMNHKGTDGSMAWDRVDRYGAWQSKVSENMSFGPMTARDVVTALLVDDGIADRGHRKNILDRDVRVVGIACGPHKTYRVMCDIVHAAGFTERQTAVVGNRE
ncbi:MAG TPA: CAP domain-containing protein [Gemmatimonadaceae bacterium]|nr:CAP domain-containing protein [Gemmatimonadaceae bacterium]